MYYCFHSQNRVQIFAIQISAYLNLKFSFKDLPANVTWSVCLTPRLSHSQGNSSSNSAAAPLCSLTPRILCQPALNSQPCACPEQNMEGDTALKLSLQLLLEQQPQMLARWHRQVIRQHYIHVTHRDIPERLPMTWLRAAQFQRPKQRELRRFPLMLAYATLIHFLQSFCQ